MFSQKDKNSHTARAASFNHWEKGYWRKTNAEWFTKGSGGSSSFSLFFSPFWLFWYLLFFPEEIPENSVDLRPNKTHKSCYSFGRLPIKNPSFKRGYRWKSSQHISAKTASFRERSHRSVGGGGGSHDQEEQVTSPTRVSHETSDTKTMTVKNNKW